MPQLSPMFWIIFPFVVVGFIIFVLSLMGEGDFFLEKESKMIVFNKNFKMW